MNYLFFIAALLATELQAQPLLRFDKRFVESENTWVAFKPDQDSAYAYGFIYIDPQAGLTLDYGGSFKVLPTGVFVAKRWDSASMKVRLEHNNVLVAAIPSNKFAELGVSAVPDWLRYYQTDTNSVARLYRWGYLYNGWNECAKALTYLKRAQKLDPNFKGLAVELSFSYNCLQQYNKAETILEAEIKANPTDAYVNKEYIYTLSKNNKIDKAAARFEESLKSVKDRQYNAENCYNILQYYYNQKDKTNFVKWYAVLQRQPNENKTLSQYVANMKAEMDK